MEIKNGELERVIKVGLACSRLTGVLEDVMKEETDPKRREALMMSAVETVVHGMYTRMIDKPNEEEMLEFALKVFNRLRDYTKLQLVEIGGTCS